MVRRREGTRDEAVRLYVRRADDEVEEADDDDEEVIRFDCVFAGRLAKARRKALRVRVVMTPNTLPHCQ